MAATPKLKIGIIGVIAMGILIIVFSHFTMGNLDDAAKNKDKNADTGGKNEPVKVDPPTEEAIESIVLHIGNEKYVAFIENSDAAQEFAKQAPFGLDMKDENGKAKTYTGRDKFDHTKPEVTGRLQDGDLLLLGNDTIVLVYKDFDTEEEYTRLGWVQNAYELKDVLGSGDISIDFTKQ